MITILGTGGHGWLSLENFILNHNGTINIYNLPVDYGGSGGIWYRLLEHHDFEMNLMLNSEKRPILPWGDFNKFLIHFYTAKYGSLVGKVLDFRSNNYEEHFSNFELLSDTMVLEKDVHEAFWNFFSIGFQYYLEHKDELDYDCSKGFCLGYPWQDYVYWNLGGVADVNVYYKQKGIIPEHINLKFGSADRQILQAKNLNDELIIGEDNIDVHKTPFKPETMLVYELDGSLAIPHNNFMERFKECQTVIFPNGSLTNWLPYLNQPSLVQALKTKKLIWLLNPKKQINELEISSYIDFVHSKDLKPIILAPQKPFENIPENENNFSADKFEFLKKTYDIKFVLEQDKNQYDAISVSKTVNEFI